MGDRGNGHSSGDLRGWVGSFPSYYLWMSLCLPRCCNSIAEGILWSLSQETVLFVTEPDKTIMRVTERIVVWDALLVCVIRIRLQGCMVTPALGSVSSIWIDIDCAPSCLRIFVVAPAVWLFVTPSPSDPSEGNGNAQTCAMKQHAPWASLAVRWISWRYLEDG